MSLNDHNNNLTKNTYISLGLAITLVCAIVFNQVQVANIHTNLENHLTDPIIHHAARVEFITAMNGIKTSFVSKDELKLIMENMGLKMDRILDQVKQE